ncbi:MAG: GAF domain-containing protein [Archangiaceae bacterium]|nr:GAF domain-containing protein [Archangiaceae bacterium]
MRTVEQILRHSGELQQARSLADLMRTTGEAVQAMTRYHSAWIAWFDPDRVDEVRVLAASGAVEATVWETSPVVPRGTDAMVEEIAAGGRVIVVEDARTDPRTNKEMVARFGNRTIVNVPIILRGSVRGMLGTGSFGDEGVVVPTPQELESLAIFASQLAPAFDRVHALAAQAKAEAAQLTLHRHLESLQRVELMGVLAAGVAHDLNNLLSVAMSSLASIDRRPLGDDAEALADATTALERMGDISKQLLLLGRERAGPHRPLDLNDKVASTLALVRPSIPRSISVVHARGATPMVEGDPVQLEQAVANLVINARDAVGKQGRIELSVDEQLLDEVSAGRMSGGRPGRFARLRVSDDGPGIPAELQRRVFDPLFTTKPLGTGLGLAVVSRVVEQHKGFVSVHSVPGHGATFELYLPALQ